MDSPHASMSVIGAGSYGTALAITMARNGHHVVLWGHNAQHQAQLQADRCNSAFLPDVPFPDSLRLETDLAAAVSASRDLLVVVPSHVFGDVLKQIKPHLSADSRLVWATKGLEKETGRLLQDVAREILGDTIPWPLFPARRSPKSWQQVCRRRLLWQQRMLCLLMICSNDCIVVKASAYTIILILSACSWAEP